MVVELALGGTVGGAVERRRPAPRTGGRGKMELTQR